MDSYSKSSFIRLSNSIGSSGYVMLHRAIIKELGLENAAFLHYLINYHQRVIYCVSHIWDDGWFFCTVGKIINELHLTQDAQLRIVKKLLGSGMIEMKKMGLPARRFFRINSDKIEKIITEWAPDVEKSAPLDGPKSAPHSNKDLIVRNIGGGQAATPMLGISRPGRPKGKPVPSHLVGFPTTAAQRLIDALKTNGADLAGRVKCETLAGTMYDLVHKRGISEGRIKRVIRWLAEHYVETYTPKLYKRDDFRDHFARIEDAMKRWCHDNDQPVPEDVDRRKTIGRVWGVARRLQTERGHDINDWDDGDIEDALRELGLPPGSVTAEELE